LRLRWGDQNYVSSYATKEFLFQSSRAALGFSLLPFVTLAPGNQRSVKLKSGVPSETLIAGFEKLIPKLMEEAMVPGLSIALIKEAKLFWRRGFGVKDNASKEPVGKDTVFEAASVSKTVFAPYMKANLLVPFGMAASGYAWNDTFEKRMARPHDQKGKPFDNNKPTATDVARYAAAGELRTTPTDYAKFLIEVIDPRESDAHRLNKESRKEMLRPQVKVAD
jgi:CubicO group peptidase (beta-lactamase class C family)